MDRPTPRKSIWSHTAIYGIGTAINSASGLVLIPLYAHLLTPAEFGTYSIIVVTGELIRILASRGLSAAMVRVYFDASDEQGRSRVISTALAGFLLLGLAIAVLVYPLSMLASRLLFESSDYGVLVALSFAANFFALLFDIQLDYFRLREDSRMFLLLSIVKSGWLLSLTLLIVVIWQMGVFGIILSTLVGMSSLSVGLLIVILRRTGFQFNRSLMMQMLHLAMPMVPSNMADVSTNSADKYFINHYVSTAVVGDYALANRIGSLLVMFIAGPFNQIWVVRRLLSLSVADDQRAMSRVFTQFLAVICTAGLGLSLFAPELVNLISSGAYERASKLIPLTCLSFVFMPLSMNFELDLLHAKKTYLIMYASVGAALVNIVIMYFLVTHFGAFGAATAMVVTNACRVVFTAGLGRSYCQSSQHFDWKRAAVLVGTAAGAYTLTLIVVGDEMSPAKMLVKGLLLMGFALGAALLSRGESAQRDTAN